LLPSFTESDIDDTYPMDLLHAIWMWIPILGRYHPDKNADNPEASELFKEVAYSYSILSDPEKKRQYDSAGFEVLFSLYSILFSAKFCGVCACVFARLRVWKCWQEGVTLIVINSGIIINVIPFDDSLYHSNFLFVKLMEMMYLVN
jgi:hypothetical protein